MEHIKFTEAYEPYNAIAGTIETDKLDSNQLALLQMKVVSAAMDHRGLRFFDALGDLGRSEARNLIEYFVQHGHMHRKLLYHVYLQDEQAVKGLASVCNYYSGRVRDTLAKHFGWDAERIEWVFEEYTRHTLSDMSSILMDGLPDHAIIRDTLAGRP